MTAAKKDDHAANPVSMSTTVPYNYVGEMFIKKNMFLIKIL